MTRFPTFRRAPLTLLYALALVLVHEIVWLAGGDELVSSFARAWATSYARPEAWWTMLTSGMVHGEWNHLWRNVVAILAFGLWLEPRLGTARLAALVVAAEIISSVAGLMFEKSGSHGASGVAFALAGALVGRPIWTGSDGIRRYNGIWLVFLYITATCYLGDAGVVRVSHAGHVAGLVTGLWFGLARWPEDPPGVPRRVRLSHAGALCMVTCAIVAAETADPRWMILREWRAARNAEIAGDHSLAERHWRNVVCTADPAVPFDAEFINDAARYRLRRQDDHGALTLLVTIARTADTPKIHRDIGFLRARLDPPDERGALEAWRNSYHTEKDQADVLNAMAHAKICTEDTLLYRPEQAVDLARRAVYLDHMREGWFMRTLALALFEVDEYDQALRWMDRAIGHADSAARVTFEEDAAWMRRWLKENPPPGRG